MILKSFIPHLTYLMLLVLLIGCSYPLSSQSVKQLGKNKKTSLRGLSVVNDLVFWASGSNGTVAYSSDGGRKIQWLTVAGYEDRDFRDIEAFDEKTALIMAVDNPAIILKTTDAGMHWKPVYEKNEPGMFLDAMAFDGDHGVCAGDPINGRFFIIETFDSGDHWEELPIFQRPEALPGEALFAASGSVVQFVNEKKYEWGFVTGGYHSRLVLVGADISVFPFSEPLAMRNGKSSTGAFSWAVNGKNWFIAGGDYKNPKLDSGNHVFKSTEAVWQTAATGMYRGYKSSVCWISDTTLAACGPGGVWVSGSNMTNWKKINRKSYHVVARAKNGKSIFLAGAKGRLAKME